MDICAGRSAKFIRAIGLPFPQNVTPDHLFSDRKHAVGDADRFEQLERAWIDRERFGIFGSFGQMID